MNGELIQTQIRLAKIVATRFSKGSRITERMKRKVILCLMTLFLGVLTAAWFVPQGRSFISLCLYRLRGDTGTIYFYDNQNGREYQNHYCHSSREGVWKVWDKSGKLLRQCEYRNNYPWDGVCQLIDDKSWLGEYKNGQPWNGYIPKSGKDYYTQPEGWGYFIDGKETSYSEYNNRRGKSGSKSIFCGLYIVGNQNTNEDSSVHH